MAAAKKYEEKIGTHSNLNMKSTYNMLNSNLHLPVTVRVRKLNGIFQFSAWHNSAFRFFFRLFTEVCIPIVFYMLLLIQLLFSFYFVAICLFWMQRYFPFVDVFSLKYVAIANLINKLNFGTYLIFLIRLIEIDRKIPINICHDLFGKIEIAFPKRQPIDRKNK